MDLHVITLSLFCAHAFHVTPLTLSVHKQEKETPESPRKEYKKITKENPKMYKYPAITIYDHRNTSNMILILSYNLM